MVYADFDFLPGPLNVGVLNCDSVRGKEVYSFSFDPQWLERFGSISLSKDIMTKRGQE